MKRTSLPRGMPLPSAVVRATTLATPVRNVRYSFKATPRKIVFISGIPEPSARKTAVRAIRKTVKANGTVSAAESAGAIKKTR